MRPFPFLSTMLLLGSISAATPAQDVFLQQEGKFLFPPNLTTRSDNLLMGLSIGSVPGFPITATIDAENTRTDSHGKTVLVRFRSKIYRDSKGRTRLEWNMTPLGESPKPGWFSIDIYDPTTRTIICLWPANKTATKSHFPAPDEKPQQVCKDSDFPRMDPKELAQIAIPEVLQNELEHDVVDGMQVRHGRESVKYPPNSFGKNPPYETLTDYWFSQELQYFVLVKRSGPGKTQHTVKLSGVSRSEPESALFAVPPDYHVSKFPRWNGDCSPHLTL